jgi:hypothetical protein
MAPRWGISSSTEGSSFGADDKAERSDYQELDDRGTYAVYFFLHTLLTLNRRMADLFLELLK